MSIEKMVMRVKIEREIDAQLIATLRDKRTWIAPHTLPVIEEDHYALSREQFAKLIAAHQGVGIFDA